MKLSPRGAPTSSSSARMRPCDGAPPHNLTTHAATARQRTATCSTTLVMPTDGELDTVIQAPLA